MTYSKDKEVVRYGRRRALRRLIDKIAKLQPIRHERIVWLREMRAQFQAGAIIVDPDDERTTAGLTPCEVRFIRGEACWACMKVECNCDDLYRTQVKEAYD